MKNGFRFIGMAAIALAIPAVGAAQDAQPAEGAAATAAADLSAFSMEELLTLESTSVAKKRQSVSDSAAAVTIITQDDIRRSGATQLVDLLRLAPGVEVGQLDANSAAVAVRGFNTRLSNSLLVMVDGRSVYVSALSGVFWDQQLVPLADIERIEIVRGPGATMWGSNAVNGVINIITRQSLDAQGLRVNANAGTQDRTLGVNYGGMMGDTVSYRVYAGGRHSDNLYPAVGDQLDGASRSLQTGFRVDIVPNERDTVTIQGDAQWGEFTSYRLNTPPFVPVPGFFPDANRFFGQNALVRWTRRLPDMDIGVQAYVDNVGRREFGAQINQVTADLDTSLRWQANDRHEFVVGIGARAIWDETIGVPGSIDFSQTRNTDQWISGFIQDDIWLVQDRLRLSLGTKLEYNSITGTVLQPSARILWRAADGVSLWAAYSRAARLPARYERTLFYNAVVPPQTPANPSPLPIFSTTRGHETLDNVTLDAWEAGLRAEIFDGWSVDLAAYYNDYEGTIALVPVSQTLIGFPPTGILSEAILENAADARSYGVEVSVTGAVTPHWRVIANYSYLNLAFRTANPFVVPLTTAGASPPHQASLRSQWDVGDRLELDATIRYVDRLPDQPVPSYVDLSTRIAYRLTDTVELGIVGRNLLDARRTEFGQVNFPVLQTFVPRSAAVTLAARF